MVLHNNSRNMYRLLHMALLVLAMADDIVPDDVVERRDTLNPTIITNATSNPTSQPTSPTAVPSSAPSLFASSVPTLFPTTSPSINPSASFMPSHAPSDSPRPSFQPSISMKPSLSPAPSQRPSQHPSQIPSVMPSSLPSLSPSVSLNPTISPAPTVTPSPTVSMKPSAHPTTFPSALPTTHPTVSPMPSSVPSETPSAMPTISTRPSYQPSISNAPTISAPPSMTPSQVPSDVPTLLPSVSPSTSPPSLFPSFLPTNQPTAIPTLYPTGEPSTMPTLSSRFVVQPKIIMLLEGLPELLDERQQEEWVNITQHHVWSYFRHINDLVPGLVPVNVTSVVSTIFQRQKIESIHGQSLLSIDYSQTIEFGLWNPNDDDAEVREDMFTAPFLYDKRTYLLELVLAWDLEDWLDLKSIQVGDTDAPTIAPTVTAVTHDNNSSPSERSIRAISACIVLSAILVVAFLLWDRHKKDEAYRQEMETMDYDNAGQPVDWRNPYESENGVDDSAVSAAPSLETGVQPSTPERHRRTETPLTTTSTLTPGGAGNSRHSRKSNLPPLAPTSRTHETVRNTAISDTDITDVTYSDGGGGGRSDNGSEGGPPLLPTISDERRSHFSPLRIPDQESYGIAVTPPSSPPRSRNMLGLDPVNSPSLSGFQMQVQELE